MSETPLRIAVVGHTNTGKTSLMRTLLRDESFGEVSDRPATTRHVEGAAVLVNGAPIAELYDTPGLEDSSALLDHLDALRGSGRSDGFDAIRLFLESPEAHGRFAQEAKAIRQVLAVDVALYVIDARDRVLGKHRDELEILRRSARPVVPVLNFIAGEQAQTQPWREHLSRAGLHAVAEFDTVVYDHQSERRLLEKLQSLLDHHRRTIDAWIADRQRQHDRLIRASAVLIAELLLDVAALVQIVPVEQHDLNEQSIEQLKQRIRLREEQCTRQLLELHRFSAADCAATALPVSEGRFGLDLFSPEALKQFGIVVGRGAAVGAAVGLAVDVVAHGLSLGAAMAAGAGLGALVESWRSQGRRWIRRAQGMTELRCDDATLRLLTARQISLTLALLRRGHAAQEPLKLQSEGVVAGLKHIAGRIAGQKLPPSLVEARVHPDWSSLNEPTGPGVPDLGRGRALDDLVRLVEQRIRRPDDSAQQFP